MKTGLKILPAGIALAAAAVAACSSDGCLDNRSALPLAACYSSQTDEAVTLRGIAIHGIGAPGDSLLLDSTQSVSQIYLPMRAGKSETSWCLEYGIEGLNDPRFNDTVTFRYTAEPFFVSEECGAMYNYHIHSVSATAHMLDSVVVLDSLITNVDIVRIRLYFPTEQ